MALRLSTGLRQALITTDDFKSLMDGGFLDIYSGSQPTNADAIETGTLLCSITTGTAGTAGITFGTAASGILPKSADGWQGTVLVAGVAGWARLYGPGKTTGTNGTAYRMDMNAGLSGADLVLSHTNLVADTIQTVKTFSITQPANA